MTRSLRDFFDEHKFAIICKDKHFTEGNTDIRLVATFKTEKTARIIRTIRAGRRTNEAIVNMETLRVIDDPGGIIEAWVKSNVDVAGDFFEDEEVPVDKTD